MWGGALGSAKGQSRPWREGSSVGQWWFDIQIDQAFLSQKIPCGGSPMHCSIPGLYPPEAASPQSSSNTWLCQAEICPDIIRFPWAGGEGWGGVTNSSCLRTTKRDLDRIPVSATLWAVWPQHVTHPLKVWISSSIKWRMQWAHVIFFFFSCQGVPPLRNSSSFYSNHLVAVQVVTFLPSLGHW